MKKEIKQEIKWNIINALIAGGLVFAGSFANGEITSQGIIAALSASVIVAITRFKSFWSSKKAMKGGLFNFI